MKKENVRVCQKCKKISYTQDEICPFCGEHTVFFTKEVYFNETKEAFEQILSVVKKSSVSPKQYPQGQKHYCSYCRSLLQNPEVSCPNCGAPPEGFHQQAKAKKQISQRQTIAIQKQKKRNRLWKRLGIAALAIFLLSMGITSFFRINSIQYKAYDAAKKQIKLQFEASKIFSFDDAKITHDKVNQTIFVQGIITTRNDQNQSVNTEIQCSAPVVGNELDGTITCAYLK